MELDRVSLEPSRHCSKACAFCYNGSGPSGARAGDWTAPEVIALASDCARHGVRALSLGGGEPLEWRGLFETLRGLDGVLFRSLTTNGLPLRDEAVFERLVAARPDKVHVSLHAPENPAEVERVVHQVQHLARAGLASGVNLLVRKSRLAEATAAARVLQTAGVGNERVVYLPMRAEGGRDAPLPREVAAVAGGAFQSMTCLRACGKSPRFASIAADRTVAWCSYTTERRALAAPTWAALHRALDGLGLTDCAQGGLVRLGARSHTA